MEEFKIYSVSDIYIDYLRKTYPNVYSNKLTSRIHTRKYVGTVIQINNFNYYIPLSSPKESDYQRAGNEKVIKKSIVPIIRIVVKNAKGKKELKGTLRVSHMIPVPDSELELYDVAGETDHAYKDLIQNEMIFIRKNKDRILSSAKLLYKQKKLNDQSAGYVQSALPYIELERLCAAFIAEICSENFG